MSGQAETSNSCNETKGDSADCSPEEKLEENDDEIVYLFSSASRARYTEDIYNSMAYPPEFIIQFRYRRPWWGPKIKSMVKQGNYSNIEGANAVVVAAPYQEQSNSESIDLYEEDRSKYRFYPLRSGEIINASLRGDTLHLYLQLDAKLVEYPEPKGGSEDSQLSSNYTDLIQGFDLHPRLGYEDNDDDVFVFYETDEMDYIPSNGTDEEGKESLLEWHDNEIESAWNTLVNNLGNTEVFKETLFFRLTRCTRLGKQSNNNVSPQEIYSGEHVGYVLSSNNQYSFKFSLQFAGSPPEKSRNANLKVTTGEKIETLPSRISLGFNTDEQDVIIDPVTKLDSFNSSLIVDSEADFFTPNLNIPIHVDPSCQKYFPHILVVAGISIVVISPHLASLGHIIYSSVAGGDLPLVNRSISKLGWQLIGTILSVIGVNWYGAWLDF